MAENNNNSREAIKVGTEVKSEIVEGKWFVTKVHDDGIRVRNEDNTWQTFFSDDQYEVVSKLSGLSIKLDVDVSEAIIGLKAVQREAREATKALRELEKAIQERKSGVGYSYTTTTGGGAE